MVQYQRKGKYIFTNARNNAAALLLLGDHDGGQSNGWEPSAQTVKAQVG